MAYNGLFAQRAVFAKSIRSPQAQAARAAARNRLLGQQLKNSAYGTAQGIAGLIGLADIARRNPLATTALAIGGSALFSYGSQQQQSIPAGPAAFVPRPGSLSSNTNYNLGGTGDLVFALNRLR
jgi:hypothetical protein